MQVLFACYLPDHHLMVTKLGQSVARKWPILSHNAVAHDETSLTKCSWMFASNMELTFVFLLEIARVCDSFEDYT